MESSETFQKFMRVLKAKTAISFHLQRFIIWIVAPPELCSFQFQMDLAMIADVSLIEGL